MKRIAVCTKFLALLAIPFCCASGFAQTCCIQLSAGASNPADHVWQYNSADPSEANLMMHVKVELPSTCSSYVDISRVRLVADGTGNDANDINWVRVDLDTGCDGTVGQSAGGYPADNGTLTICHPTSYHRLNPGQSVCYLIYYNLKSTAGCGKTYHFTLTGLMKPGTPTCQLITTPPLCAPGSFGSATKTVSVYLDANQDGVRQPTEALFGSGVYPAGQHRRPNLRQPHSAPEPVCLPAGRVHDETSRCAYDYRRSGAGRNHG